MTDAISVRRPRTGEAVRIPATPAATVPSIVSRLREAQVAWGALSVESRAAELRAWASRVEAVRDDLVTALVEDTGRLRESAIEVDAVVGMLHRWAAQAIDLLGQDEPRDASIPGFVVHQARRPYPLVGVVSPWNFPLLLSMIDAIPALAAGCAVIVKPSEVTPGWVQVLAPTLPDVLAIAVGDGSLGQVVLDHVDAVCFTGSVATGRRVGEQAAANFVPAFLELGGKDPAIVLPGTDLDRTARAILWGATSNAGQACQSIERVYVSRAEHDDLVARLVALAGDLGLAHPDPSDPGLGPIIDARQARIIERHLADAVQRGAKAHTGGELEHLDGGAWVRATVLTDVDHDMLVMREETFGPIIPVMAYDDVDHAIALANDTDFGLSAAVFGPDPVAARAVAARLEAGAVSINDASLTALVHDAEKQSFGLSGLGASRMGPAALLRFSRTTAQIENASLSDDPWWWPRG